MIKDSVIIAIISDIIRKAIKPINRDYGEIIYLQSSHKGTNDFALKSYAKSEEIIVNELQSVKGNYPISNCRDTTNHDSEYRWLIEPLDGIINFSHAIPFFSVAIALQKKIADKFETVAAIIENPGFEEAFIAEKGSGAWIDNYSRFSKGKIRMRVSKRSKSEEILEVNKSKINGFSYGSNLLEAAYVASGKIDICVFDNINNKHAMIAKLFIGEAGGCIEINKENRLVIHNNAISF